MHGQVKAQALILNLDDNDAARYLKSRALRAADFDVIEAATGADALRIAREQHPDIALLDVKLPDMSGLEVCRQLKTDSRTSDIPVVQVSATHTSEGDQAAGFEHGADIYLTEPMEAIVLVTVVRTLLRLRRTESGLLASEERFKAIVNQATAGIVQTDLAGRFIHSNQRYCEIVARSAEQLLALTLFDVTHPGDVPILRDAFDRLVAGGQSFDLDKRCLRPDGGTVWSSNSVSLVRDNRGVAQHVIAIVVDITERKIAEEHNRFLAEVSERLAELTDQASTLQKVAGAVVPAVADWCAVDLVDEEGNHKRIASSHVDPSKAELLHPLSEPSANPDASTVRRVLSTRQAELIPDLSEAVVGRRGGDEKRLQALRSFGLRSYVCVPLMLRDRMLGTLAIGMGSSGRRYNERDLVVAVELGRRVSIAVENANLYQAIQQAAKRKDEFLATLAHELRNPLAPLTNSLQILRTSDSGSDLASKARGMMERQVSQLRRLVDDLLDVSRIDTGKMELRKEPILLSTVVRNAVEAVRESLEAEHKLAISLPSGDVWLHADPARLAQVLTNLLDNAEKYTPAGGRVALEAIEAGDEISIAVTDTGIGISPEMLHRIFDMFIQGDNSFERAYGGLGIGLTLVKRLVEMHDGRISAESEGPGKGSRFIVRLPRLTEAAQAARRPAEQPDSGPQPPGRKLTVLVVDDNRDSATSLAMLLDAMGHSVHTAYDGPGALEAAGQHRPDIIFLDIGLPGISGYDVARKLRQDEANRQMQVVALSGYGTAQDMQRSAQSGFDLHVVKPIDIAHLNKIVSARAAL
jgi:PAS domain S-box-containing protein